LHSACLYELYGHSFLRPSSTNDCYVNWFLQSKLRVNDEAIGPISNQRHLESLFFGTHRYILKRLMTKSMKPRLNIEMNKYHLTHTNQHCLSPSSDHDLVEYDLTSTPPSFSSYSLQFIDDHGGDRLFNSRGRPRIYPRDTSTNFRSTQRPTSILEQALQNEAIDDNDNEQHPDRYHSIMTRCSCLTTIIRNLSFIEENEYLANDRRLLDILERILNCHHQDMHQIFDYQSHVDQQYIDTCSNCYDMINIDDTQLEFIKPPVNSVFQVYRVQALCLEA
jgi:hypothetical protein